MACGIKQFIQFANDICSKNTKVNSPYSLLIIVCVQEWIRTTTENHLQFDVTGFVSSPQAY